MTLAPATAPAPSISIAPDPVPAYIDAIRLGGGVLFPVGEQTRGLIWSRHRAVADLAAVIDAWPGIRWVQLPSSGVEDYVGVFRPQVTWTSAKGAFGAPVAEHAMALALVLLRQLHVRARATEWGESAGRSLRGATVLVVGGGGIARALVELLLPFGAGIVTCRLHPGIAVRGERVVGFDDLDSELAAADVVILAAPLTPLTAGLMGRNRLGLMKPSAVLVNVARGGLVVTDELVEALNEGRLAGAALDVTEPEPLPSGHPLWASPRALITPHTANTPEMMTGLLARRIATNVAQFVAGGELDGIVDIELGY